MQTIDEAIKEISKKTGKLLPACLGDCEECDYRRDFWVNELTLKGFTQTEIVKNI